MKKILIILSLIICGCGQSTSSIYSSSPEIPFLIKINPPFLITTLGQNSEAAMIKVLIEEQKISYFYHASATTREIKNNKTILITIGASAKGMASINVNKELEWMRIYQLIQEAKKNGIVVIGMHIGGTAKRDTLSDWFYTQIVKDLDYAVYVNSGNSDGFLSSLLTQNQVPFKEVSSVKESLLPILKLMEE